LKLIQELADYEKALHEVINTEKQLSLDWQAGRFQFFMAELAQQAVGMALFYPRYSTWKGLCYYLEDLYVMPDHRGKGIGKALIDATAQAARLAGAKRLDWQVLDWNQPAVTFYESLGARLEKEWWNCKWSF
jgi:GNAT superfamily N-acetyltransferase